MDEDILKFLLGEGKLDGVWFGDKHPTEKGAFWWRKHLRQHLEQAQLQQHDVVRQSEPFYCWDEYALGKGARCSSQCEICVKCNTKQ